MFPLDLDPNVNKAMVQYQQEQVRTAFPRKITRWIAPVPQRFVRPVSATATPSIPESRMVA